LFARADPRASSVSRTHTHTSRSAQLPALSFAPLSTVRSALRGTVAPERDASSAAATVEIRKYDFVDALRGYAVLGVIAVHAAGVMAWGSAPLQRFAVHGARGVQLFYVASALTLCMSWQARSASERAPLRNFLLRRLFRILPLFYLAIAFYSALYGFESRYWAPNGVAWWFLPLTAACLHGFHPELVNSVVPGGWSIAVEMIFYLMLPWLFRLLRGPLSAGALFFAALGLYVASGIAIHALLLPHYPPEQHYLVAQFRYLTIAGQLPVFALGLGTYTLLRAPERVRFALGLAGTLGYAAIKALVRAGSGKDAFLDDHIVVSIALACFALLLSARPSSPLINKLIVALGRLSFSMYLVHFAVLHVLAKAVPYVPWRGDGAAALFLAVTVACSAALSHATYRLIELPGIAWGKRCIERLEGRLDARPAASYPAA
jgi:peptidoglycan/LPS O-acetylase OafA/YrhL